MSYYSVVALNPFYLKEFPAGMSEHDIRILISACSVAETAKHRLDESDIRDHDVSFGKRLATGEKLTIEVDNPQSNFMPVVIFAHDDFQSIIDDPEFGKTLAKAIISIRKNIEESDAPFTSAHIVAEGGGALLHQIPIHAEIVAIIPPGSSETIHLDGGTRITPRTGPRVERFTSENDLEMR